MKRRFLIIAMAMVAILGSHSVQGQTTSFSYQGTLDLGGTPANGSFDFEFRLYDALSGGGQIGTTNSFNAVGVRNGQFTVTLSFGANAFPGEARWIQISVRQAGGGAYTTLLPRQGVTATPYAITSFKAVSLTGTLAIAGGGTGATDVAAARSNLGAAASGANTDITALVGLTTPLGIGQGGTGVSSASAARVSLSAAGSGANSDITALTGLTTPLTIEQGGTGAKLSQQARINLGAAASGNNSDITSLLGLSVINVSGNGTFSGGLSAGSVNSLSSYNLNGIRIMSFPATNSYIGINSGNNTTSGIYNTFIGDSSGYSNTNGSSNVFIGYGSGYKNISGVHNIFIGYNAGYSNTTGGANSFIGSGSGASNTSGESNTFFGNNAGNMNISGSSNVFMGTAGRSNTSGSGNTFTGAGAGDVNDIGIENSFFGYAAGYNNTNGIENTFIGGKAGYMNASGSMNTFVGLSAGHENSESGNTYIGFAAGNAHRSGKFNAFLGYKAGADEVIYNAEHVTLLGAKTKSADNIKYGVAIGAQSEVLSDNTIVIGRSNGNDKVIIHGLGANGQDLLCRNADRQISSCSASLVKSSITAATSGINSDITSLQGLTTPLSPQQGGSGISSIPTAQGQFLRSPVAGAWGIGSITSSDIPNLSGSYVDLTSNQTIAGNKTFTGSVSGAGTFSWQVITSNLTASTNRGYIADSTDPVTITLPSNPSIGDVIRINGLGTGGWRIATGAGQTVITSLSSLVSTLSLWPWEARESQRVWVSVASSADGNTLVALNQGGQIYTSFDAGVTWTARESNRTWYSVALSSDGTKMVAVVGAGQIYTSTDSGVTWSPRDNTRNWQSVACSADGNKLVAVVFDGLIYTSTDSGVTWIPRESNRTWHSVASSADGNKLVGVVRNGQIYTSNDSGVTWTPRESNRRWYSVASSADGNKLVAVVSGGQIYTSIDSGMTWTPRESVRDWRSVASSADGTKLVAVVSGGQIYTSTDSGVTWTPRESSRDWWSVASSADGTKLIAGVYSGQLYTSTGPENSSGFEVAAGRSLVGNSSSAIEIVYIGNGRFLIVTASGNLSFGIL